MGLVPPFCRTIHDMVFVKALTQFEELIGFYLMESVAYG